MLSKRIIACLDVRDGKVVKGVNFEGLRDAGDPAALARRYNVEGIDEVVILDVTATIESRQARAHTIAAVAKEIFLPLTVGGGIRSEEDAAAAIEAGADKVSLNSAALANPELITTLARRYGSQAVIVAIDAKGVEAGLQSPLRYEVFARSGQSRTSRDVVEWAREATDRGAGEILLTSIDRDGLRCRQHSGDRLRRRRHLRPLRRGVWSRPRRRSPCRIDLSLQRTERGGAEAASALRRNTGAAVNRQTHGHRDTEKSVLNASAA